MAKTKQVSDEVLDELMHLHREKDLARKLNGYMKLLPTLYTMSEEHEVLINPDSDIYLKQIIDCFAQLKDEQIETVSHKKLYTLPEAEVRSRLEEMRTCARKLQQAKIVSVLARKYSVLEISFTGVAASSFLVGASAGAGAAVAWFLVASGELLKNPIGWAIAGMLIGGLLGLGAIALFVNTYKSVAKEKLLQPLKNFANCAKKLQSHLR